MKNNESGSRRQVRPTLKNNNYKIRKLSYYENNSASKSSKTKQNQVEWKTRNNHTEGPINKTEKIENNTENQWNKDLVLWELIGLTGRIAKLTK